MRLLLCVPPHVFVLTVLHVTSLAEVQSEDACSSSPDIGGCATTMPVPSACSSRALLQQNDALTPEQHVSVSEEETTIGADVHAHHDGAVMSEGVAEDAARDVISNDLGVGKYLALLRMQVWRRVSGDALAYGGGKRFIERAFATLGVRFESPHQSYMWSILLALAIEFSFHPDR